MNETIYAIWLSALKGMTPNRCYTLFKLYGSFAKIYYHVNISFNEHFETRSNSPGLTKSTIQQHKEQLNKFEDYYYKILDKGIYVLTPLDSEFPEKLKELVGCPITLYVKGNYDFPLFGIGIVGARRCSLYGKKVAKQFGKDLASQGVNVISGLAYGVDVASHLGALESGGFTTAVLGGGLHRCYPTKHQSIFEEITQKGCLVSEEPYGVNTEPYMFPKRNRIISGMSHGILVVEAAKKSGSLITVDFALEQGREVFTIPGRLFDPLAEGTNNLVKQGAKVVYNYDDILSEFVHIFKKKDKKSDKIEKKLEEKEKIVYSCISYDPVHEELLVQHVFEAINLCIGTLEEVTEYNKDELIILNKMEESDIHLSLLILEIKGLIVKKSGCYYARSEV